MPNSDVLIHPIQNILVILLNKWSGFDQRDLDLCSIVNDAQYFPKKRILKRLYFKHLKKKILNSKISLFMIGYEMSLEKIIQ